MSAIETHTLRLSGGSKLAFFTAGERNGPPLLLVHGLPNSSRMFRDLATRLADVAYVIAPDLPGFGASEPLASPSFDAIGEALRELLEHLETGPRHLYLHDYGAPGVLRLAMRAPDQVLGLIIQNANAHDSGHGPNWADTLDFWRHPTPENEVRATAHLTLEGTRGQYVDGVPPDIAAKIPPELWEEDWRVMSRPGRMETQRALLRDYGRYIQRFGAIADYLKTHQPPALLLWGRHDIYFDIAEVVSWMRDLPRMEAHVFDAGHLMLETHTAEAAPVLRDFIMRTSARRCDANRTGETLRSSR